MYKLFWIFIFILKKKIFGVAATARGTRCTELVFFNSQVALHRRPRMVSRLPLDFVDARVPAKFMNTVLPYNIKTIHHKKILLLLSTYLGNHIYNPTFHKREREKKNEWRHKLYCSRSYLLDMHKKIKKYFLNILNFFMYNFSHDRSSNWVTFWKHVKDFHLIDLTRLIINRSHVDKT